MLRGLCRDWPATRAAERSWEELAAYLLRFDSGTLAQAFVGEPSIRGRYYYSDDLAGFNFERVDMELSDALARMGASAVDPAQPSVYFGSVPAENYIPGFSEENRLAIMPPQNLPLLWLGNPLICQLPLRHVRQCCLRRRRPPAIYAVSARYDR